MGAVTERYLALVASGAWQVEPAQLSLCEYYDSLLHKIVAAEQKSSSLLGKLFSSKPPLIKGLYVHGHVGRGKSALMDMFFDLAPLKEKQRIHFNNFMKNMHERIKFFREENAKNKLEKDALLQVAQELASKLRLLCFDEFTVTDIADAMILARLFAVLFQSGVILVATSNVAPQDLYSNGLNRALFLPFIKLLTEHVTVINLDLSKDYRLEKSGIKIGYIFPLTEETGKAFEEAWQQALQDYAKGEVEQPKSYSVKGHVFEVPRQAGRLACFKFKDLCGKPFSASDYITVFAHYDRVFIDDVPQLFDEDRNVAKRFILVVDVLYDQQKQVFIRASAAPEDLYCGKAEVTEKFEFARTSSRLVEMQSVEYQK